MTSAAAVVASAPPINRRMLETLVRKEVVRKQSRRLLLVYVDHPSTQFTLKLDEDQRYAVTVVACAGVLAVADAWEQFQAGGERTADGATRLLVVTTGLPTAEIGLSLRGYAAHMTTITVSPSDLVREQFSVRELDWRVTQKQWLLDALLGATPNDGWRQAAPHGGSLLTWDSAVSSLLAVRLGLGSLDADGGAPDASAVLDWSRGTGPDRFATLSEDERGGIAEWLAEATGPVAAIVLRLAELGRAGDAVALGLLCTTLDPARSAKHADGGGASDALLLLGALFGRGGPSIAALTAYAQAVEGTVHRWIAAAEVGGDRAREHRGRVFDVVERAEALAAGYPHLQTAFRDSATMPSGFTARLAAFVEVVTANELAQAEAAYETLAAHRLAILHLDRLAVAEMALRLLRWVHEPDSAAPVTTAGWLTRHLAVLGWVDRGLNVLYHGDPEPGRDAVAAERVAAAYRALHVQILARRDAMDRSFAAALAGWAAAEETPSRSGTLLIEEVLATVVAPLASGTGRPPLILVLDGMSSAVATEFGERLTRRNVLTEIALPMAGAPTRMAAAAVIPSVTRFSRTSLLCGTRRAGGQREEKDGFASFWRSQGLRTPALLFHKREIADELAGGRLNPEVTSALTGDAVVAVVLNDVDDALDKGGRGDRTQWGLENVTHFESLIDQARSFGRPIVLVADHGHVLDRSAVTDGPSGTASSDKSQRYRSADGEPAQNGEVLLSGPRVMDFGGALVAAVSEHRRYTSRKAGYHGGASLAEMTVPVLVFLPEDLPVPAGWTALLPRQVTPQWWAPAPAAALAAASAVAAEPLVKETAPRRAAKPVQAEALFALPDTEAEANAAGAQPGPAATGTTIGDRVVASDVYQDQKKFVRKMRDAEVVAAIDALHGGDQTLPVSVLAEVVGRAGTSFDGFLANLERLLNIDQYPVLSRIDSGRTVKLDLPLLSEQFGLD